MSVNDDAECSVANKDGCHITPKLSPILQKANYLLDNLAYEAKLEENSHLWARVLADHPPHKEEENGGGETVDINLAGIY